MASSLTGIGAAIARLDQLTDAGKGTVAQAVTRAAALTATDAKSHASGRPGPRAPTGNFRRSITHEAARPEGGSIVARTGSNAPQSRRLEFGFVGADALGRNYNQPPYPWLTPSIPAARRHLHDEVIGAMNNL